MKVLQIVIYNVPNPTLHFFVPVIQNIKYYCISCGSYQRGNEISKEDAIVMQQKFQHFPEKEVVASMLKYIQDESMKCESTYAEKEGIYKHCMELYVFSL